VKLAESGISGMKKVLETRMKYVEKALQDVMPDWRTSGNVVEVIKLVKVFSQYLQSRGQCRPSGAQVNLRQAV
jgi:hypothetical protein